MKLINIYSRPKATLTALSILTIVTTALVIYGICYAKADSFLKRDNWMVGVACLFIWRYTIAYYKVVFKKIHTES